MFWQTFDPQALLIKFGPIQIYWYGLFLALAVLSAALVIRFLLKYQNGTLTKNEASDVVFFTIICGFIGARLWHILFYNFSYFWKNPLEIFQVWHGGLAIMGGVLGGLIFLFIYSRKKKKSIFDLVDLLFVALPLAQAIGRVGNYFNQELFGPACNYAWCIFIAPLNRPNELLSVKLFHPTFFYEAILDLLLFVWLFIIYIKKKDYFSGQIFWLYLLGYSIIRFITEFFRLDAGRVGWNLNWVQFFCLLILILALFKLLPRTKLWFIMKRLFSRKLRK